MPMWWISMWLCANKSLKVCLKVAGQHYHLICITCREISNWIKTQSHAGLWCVRSIYFASGTAALLHRDWLLDWGGRMTWTGDVLSHHLVSKMSRCLCQHFPKVTRFVVSCFWQLKSPGRVWEVARASAKVGKLATLALQRADATWTSSLRLVTCLLTKSLKLPAFLAPDFLLNIKSCICQVVRWTRFSANLKKEKKKNVPSLCSLKWAWCWVWNKAGEMLVQVWFSRPLVVAADWWNFDKPCFFKLLSKKNK